MSVLSDRGTDDDDGRCSIICTNSVAGGARSRRTDLVVGWKWRDRFGESMRTSCCDGGLPDDDFGFVFGRGGSGAL